jgi:hypothetical protein
VNLTAVAPKPAPAPQATLVLAPSYAITALATGLQVEVRARPVHPRPARR